jgi:hypothetical protein
MDSQNKKEKEKKDLAVNSSDSDNEERNRLLEQRSERRKTTELRNKYSSLILDKDKKTSMFSIPSQYPISPSSSITRGAFGRGSFTDQSSSKKLPKQSFDLQDAFNNLDVEDKQSDQSDTNKSIEDLSVFNQENESFTIDLETVYTKESITSSLNKFITLLSGQFKNEENLTERRLIVLKSIFKLFCVNGTFDKTKCTSKITYNYLQTKLQFSMQDLITCVKSHPDLIEGKSTVRGIAKALLIHTEVINSFKSMQKRLLGSENIGEQSAINIIKEGDFTEVPKLYHEIIIPNKHQYILDFCDFLSNTDYIVNSNVQVAINQYILQRKLKRGGGL